MPLAAQVGRLRIASEAPYTHEQRACYNVAQGQGNTLLVTTFIRPTAKKRGTHVTCNPFQEVMSCKDKLESASIRSTNSFINVKSRFTAQLVLQCGRLSHATTTETTLTCHEERRPGVMQSMPWGIATQPRIHFVEVVRIRATPRSAQL